MKPRMCFWNLLIIFALAFSGLAFPQQDASAVSTSIVISQVYGGGGNSGATLKNDFIELYNLGSTPVDVTGWSVQYVSAAGTGTWAFTTLSGTIQPGRYFLVQEAAGTGGTVNLPTPDVIGTIAMGASAGKVALVNNSTALTGACPTGLVDLVGYGTTANCSETAPTGNLSSSTAAIRKSNGAQDTDNNSADFTVGTPDPRNSAFVPYDPAPTVTGTNPATGATGVALASDLTVTFSEAVNAPAAAFSLSCAGSGAHTFALGTTDNLTFTLNPDVDFSEGELCTATVLAAQVTDVDTNDPYDNMAADYVFTFTSYQSDPAPTVVSTIPADYATGVAVGDPLSVTFSEAVTLAAGAVSISCAYSGVHDSAVSSVDNVTHSIVPAVPFTASERCTVTLENTLITDSGGQAMAADYSWYFTTYYNPAEITPIDVARVAGVGWTGTLQGNVTVPPGIYRNNAFAIQDATGGMYIYTGSLTLPAMALGDVVRIQGTIKNYNNLLETDPTTSVTWVSTGVVPTPEVVATGSVAGTQGKLISVSGTATLVNPPVPGAANYSFSINDGSGAVTVYVYKTTNIDLRGFTNGQQMRVIGFSGAYNTPQLQPRYQSDIIDLSAPVVTGTTPANAATGASLYKPLNAVFSKAMDPASLNPASFSLTGPSGAVSGAVTYVESTRTAVFTPDVPLAPLNSYTATLSTAVQDSYGIPLAAAYTWSFTTGEPDTTAPTITGRVPAPAATNVPLSATVAITFSEELQAGSINGSHFLLSNAFGPVSITLSYDPATFTVTLTPQANLLPTQEYTVKVTANTADIAGNLLGADDTWTFTTSVEPPMQVYFGDLHNHTGYSDGSGTPTEALTAGKAAGFDFMAISDHSYAIDDTEWANTLQAVNNATTVDFVALRGFEYTQGAEGHINVWNSTRHATRTNVAGCTYCDYTPNLEAGVTVEGFYHWLVSPVNTPLDSAGMVMQFNHPGWINFNDWYYHPEVSGIARLEEVGNGNGSSYVFSEEEFIRSLDYGWKLGATNNADTHTAAWGVNTDHRTGVVMSELTKTALLEALLQRRTFATEDKNASLTMKANGAWMGSEIANSGQILFDINGMDADGELPTLVEIITDQGKVVVSIVPTQSTFAWQPTVTITSGVHYFYVKMTQADGNRVVTSPVWTLGTEDIAITDIRIQPTIPTIYNPSLLTARITNRVAQSRTVNVVIKAGDVPLGPAVEVTVPANGDGFVNFTWQPSVIGPVTITAQMENAPVGDNPDDNSASLNLTVTDEHLPLILIDAGHGNLNTAGDEMRAFIDDLSAHHFNVLKNLDALTAADLNPAVVKLLIITAPQYAYTPEELTAIGNFINAGGSLWLGGLADYNKSLPWAATVADRENPILDAIETATGQQINMRMNDDEVIDGNTNNGYVFGVIWQNFPSASTTGIGMNVESVATWSLNSIRGRLPNEPLTATTPGVQIVMQGDLDEGYTNDTWHNPFHTSNTNADGATDAYIYNPTWVYPATKPADAIPLPGAAVTQMQNGAGRIMLYGDSNDPFTTFAYTAGDGKQNELFNLQSIMWLLGEPLTKSTIAEARFQTVEDKPDKLNNLVWVEGVITAAYGEFFNVLYVQDATGGITVHAPAGDIDPTAFTRGTPVRVIGTVDIYNGDTEIQFFEAEMVQVIGANTGEPAALPLTTLQAAGEASEGLLAVVTGKVVGKIGDDTLIVNDGSGPVRIFLDGYNGTFADIKVNDRVQVTGLVSEDGNGPRIRVRNHNAHPGIPDDVVILSTTISIYLPFVSRGN